MVFAATEMEEVGVLSQDAPPLKGKKAAKSSKAQQLKSSKPSKNSALPTPSTTSNSPGPQAKPATSLKSKFCMYQLQGVCRYSADECAYSHSTEEMRRARGQEPPRTSPSASATTKTASPEPTSPTRRTPYQHSSNAVVHPPPMPFEPPQPAGNLHPGNSQVQAAMMLQHLQQQMASMGPPPPAPSRKSNSQAPWYPEYEHAPSAAAAPLAPNPFSSGDVPPGMAPLNEQQECFPLPVPAFSGPQQLQGGMWDGVDNLEPMFLPLLPSLDNKSNDLGRSQVPPGAEMAAQSQQPVLQTPPNLPPPPSPMVLRQQDLAALQQQQQQLMMMDMARLTPDTVSQLSQCVAKLSETVGELTQMVQERPSAPAQTQAVPSAPVLEPMVPLGQVANLVDMTFAIHRLQQNLQAAGVNNSADAAALEGNLELLRRLSFAA
mmetsp:Transcript_44271/g.104807  ORF Transcript_44271/g.104807 Transcript_44271/m.104807 type:complete len:433 (+) Transcript_44271:98-1396(+)